MVREIYDETQYDFLPKINYTRNLLGERCENHVGCGPLYLQDVEIYLVEEREIESNSIRESKERNVLNEIQSLPR